MSDQRIMAVIMFTDIVGYTALLGDSQDEALALLAKSKNLQKPLMSEHQGLLLEEIDDGLLARFPTSTMALKCALDIQRLSGEHPEIEFRIGIHWGEVDHSHGNVRSEVATIAMRLEPMSLPGGITISESVYDHVHQKVDLKWQDLGKRPLRSISQPIRIYRFPAEESGKAATSRSLLWKKLLIASVISLATALAYYLLF